MSWLGVGEASSKFATVVIVFVVAIALSWTFGKAQGYNDSLTYTQEEARVYRYEIERRNKALIDASIEVAYWRRTVDKMLSVPSSTVFDCLQVVD